MKNILLIEPYSFLKNIYFNDQNIYLYENKNIISKNNNYHVFNEQFIANFETIENIKRQIEKWSPIWIRWIGAVDEFELFKNESTIFILKILNQLKDNYIKYAIFFTNSSHHVEYSLLEIALNISCIPQVFLYTTVFGDTGRLLPVIQKKSFGLRERIDFRISSYNIKNDLLDFINNSKVNLPPKLNEKFSKYETLYIYGLYILFKISIKEFIYRIYKRKKNEDNSLEFTPYKLNNFLKLFLKQNIAKKQLKKFYLNNADVDTILKNNEFVPIIFAHYQPEATTFPEGGLQSTHIDIVLQIRNLGYEGIILYKEHPNCWGYYSKITGFSKTGIYRSDKYYSQLKLLGCLFISDTYNIKKMKQCSYLPITITGTIAIERSLSGYYTCFSGNPWYKGLPGTFNLGELFSNPFLISKIKKNKTFDKAEAYNWLLNSLSFKTINNYFGISTGKISNNENDRLSFVQELSNLITYLKSS